MCITEPLSLICGEPAHEGDVSFVLCYYDKKAQQTRLKPSSGRGLHDSIYFINEIDCLCYVRVPFWLRS